MRRPLRLSLIAGVVILILLALDTAAWWLMTSRLLAEAAAWQHDRATAGYTVTAGPPSRAGWPLRAALRIPDVAIASGKPGAPNAVAWQTGPVDLFYTPWRPSEVTVALDGPQTLQLGVAMPITLQAENLDLVVPLDQAGGFIAVARRLQVKLPIGGVAVGSLWLRLEPAAFHLILSSLTLPDPGLPLGVTVNSLDVQAHSTIPLPEQRDPAAAAAAWRDAGGQLVVSAAALEWGPLDVQGRASFALDPSLQPTGNGSVRIAGYAQALDALARTGVMTRNNARVASTLLGLMSHPAEGGVPEADLPFTVHDGVLMSGAIPLLKLPALALP